MCCPDKCCTSLVRDLAHTKPVKCPRYLWVQQFWSCYSLAQDDSVLKALHEVVWNLASCDLIDPKPELFLLLRVVLLCKLEVRRQTRVTVAPLTQF